MASLFTFSLCLSSSVLPHSLVSVGAGRMSNTVAKWREIQRQNSQKTNDDEDDDEDGCSWDTPTTHNTFIVLYQSKYHCSIAYLDIFSLAVTLQQGGSPSLYVLLFYFFVFSLGWMGGPNPNPTPRLPACLPTCVIVWPLSACLPQRAVLCSSPHPLSTTPLQIPTDWPLLFLLFPRLRAAHRNWPHPHQRPLCIKSETTAAPESVLSKPLALRLHPAVITESMDGDIWFVFFEGFFFI